VSKDLGGQKEDTGIWRGPLPIDNRPYRLSVADSLAIGIQETNLLGLPGAGIRSKLSRFAQSQAVKEPSFINKGRQMVP